MDAVSEQQRTLALNMEHVTGATKMLERRRQMLEIQEAFDGQKAEYRRKDENFARREENLRKKDLELQEALVLFNKFLRENEAKRRRAERRANEEMKASEQKEQEIQARLHKIEQLTQRRAKLKKQVQQNDRYQLFLQQMQAEHPGEFATIEQVINRHKLLSSAHTELMQQQRSISDRLEALRAAHINANKEFHQVNLSLNNDIAKYSKQLEHLKKVTAAIEEKVDTSLKTNSALTLHINQITLAVDNLYQRCRKASRIINHTKSLDDVDGINEDILEQQDVSVQKKVTEAKLQVILAYVIDFHDIVMKYGAK